MLDTSAVPVIVIPSWEWVIICCKQNPILYFTKGSDSANEIFPWSPGQIRGQCYSLSRQFLHKQYIQHSCSLLARARSILCQQKSYFVPDTDIWTKILKDWKKQISVCEMLKYTVNMTKLTKKQIEQIKTVYWKSKFAIDYWRFVNACVSFNVL